MAESILIVDDEESIRSLLEAWLNDVGYQTYTASDGQDGLRKLHEHQPDMIICDVWMPGMDGYMFCRLARRASNAAIMMMTGVRQEAAVLKEMDVGVDGYMVKPVEMSKFLEQVELILEKRHDNGVPNAHNVSSMPEPPAAPQPKYSEPESESPAPPRQPSESAEAIFAKTYRKLSEDDRKLIHTIADRLLSASGHNP